MRRAEVDSFCCFCNAAGGDADLITLVAFWAEGGQELVQAWEAHRACLIERLAPYARDVGGPLFDD